MSLAYCILAHKNPSQVARLLQAIWHPDNFYVLHYEKRAPQSEHQAIFALTEKYSNIHILQSQAILWGSYQHIESQLRALAICLQTECYWSHFIGISGQDFPLLPQNKIINQLSSVPQATFMEYFDPLKTAIWSNASERIHRIYISSPKLERFLSLPFVGRRIKMCLGWTNSFPFIPLFRRRYPQTFRYYGGSNHVVLSRESAKYISNAPQARRIIHWLRWSGIPDESVFQSVLLNSPLCNQIINDNRRAIFWDSKGAPSPRVLTSSDIVRLEKSRDTGKLFARKFDVTIDEHIVSRIEAELGLSW